MLKIKRAVALALATALAVAGLSASAAGPATANQTPGFRTDGGSYVVTPTGERVKVGKAPAAKLGQKGAAPADARKSGVKLGSTYRTKQPGSKLLAATYRYAGGQQAGTWDGAKANTEVVSVGTLDSGDHSLIELSVQRDAAGSMVDAVEIGFQKGEAGCGSQCLFIYSWENGVGQGYNGGNGYTDINDACGAGGTNVLAGQAETAGTSVSLGILYGGSPVGWYFYRANCGFGYIAASNWAGTTFTSATSTFNQAFWEVYDNDGSAAPCSNMGNGGLASPMVGAVLGSYLLGSAPSGSVNLVPFTQDIISTSYYDIEALSLRTMRGGGPGSC